MNPDDVPSSLLDYAIQFAASQLKEKIKPQMRVSAFEDNFHTIFESFCKKQARRSRINWKKRYLRLRCRTLCVSLSHFIQHTHTHTHTHTKHRRTDIRFVVLQDERVSTELRGSDSFARGYRNRGRSAAKANRGTTRSE